MQAFTRAQPLSTQQARRDVLFTLALAIAAGVAGYLVVRDPLAAGTLALAPTAVWLFVKRRIACVLLGAAIPFAQDVTGGRLGVNLAVSDILMMLIFISVVADALLTRRFAAARALGPLRLPVLQYIVLMLLLLIYHLGFGTLFQTGQRLELFLIPMVIGAVMAIEGHWQWVLRAYVVASTLLAAAWPFIVSGDQGLGIQKNPAGQFIANAIILLIAVQPIRRLLPFCMPVLVIGLLWTQSRGAIVSVGVGLIVLLLMQAAHNRRRLYLQLVPLSMLTLAAFRFLPESAQQRNTTFSVAAGTDAGRALKYRADYRADAWELIHQHPVVGVGVGQYRAGSDALLTTTTDPHQVLLLQAAEGGYLLAGLFVALIVGTVAVLARCARRTALGPAAAAVTLAIAAHGLVDIYWVRATPVLGWLLVGMALAQARTSEGKS